MQAGELYVAYSGMQEDGIELLTYGDSRQTPRVYTSENLDPRLGKVKVCQTLLEANQSLGGEILCVLLPLSEMVTLFGAPEVRQWANVNENATEIRKYVDRLC